MTIFSVAFMKDLLFLLGVVFLKLKRYYLNYGPVWLEDTFWLVGPLVKPYLFLSPLILSHSFDILFFFNIILNALIVLFPYTNFKIFLSFQNLSVVKLLKHLGKILWRAKWAFFLLWLLLDVIPNLTEEEQIVFDRVVYVFGFWLKAQLKMGLLLLIKLMRYNFLNFNIHFYIFALILCFYRISKSPFLNEKDPILNMFRYYYQFPDYRRKFTFCAVHYPWLVITLTIIFHVLLFNVFFSLLMFPIVFFKLLKFHTAYYTGFCFVAAWLTFYCFPNDPMTKFFNVVQAVDYRLNFINEDTFKFTVGLVYIYFFIKYFLTPPRF